MSNVTIAKMTIAEIFNQSADYLDKHGWRQKDYGVNGGPRCAAGAMASVLKVDIADVRLNNPDYDQWVEAIVILDEWVRKNYPLDPCTGAFTWNDMTHMSAEEVIKGLRTAADHWKILNLKLN